MTRLLARGGLLLAAAVLVLAATELALTRLHPAQPGLELRPQLDSRYLYRLAPATTGNVYGIQRAAPVGPEPEPGVLRVLSYGDSVASGYGVAAADMYAVRLERALAREGRAGFDDVEILTMARGHSPTAYAFHLRLDVPELEPHAVLVEIELSNDVSDEARVRTRGRDGDGLPRALTGYRYVLSWDGQLLATGPIGLGPFERTRLQHALVRAAGRLAVGLRVPPAFREGSDTFYYSLRSDRYSLSDAALERGFERTFEVLAGMRRYLDRRGVRMLVAILPSKYAFEAGSRFQPGALRLLARAEGRARELGIPFVSLRGAIAARGGGALFMDFCHPTVEGNRAIAEGMLPELEKWAATNPP